MAQLTDHVLHSAAGRFDATTDSKTADVKRIVDLALAAKRPHGLLLHFHGGLIGKKSGLEIATKLLPRYEAAGTYPIFFVWESGLLESLTNNKDDIARDPAFRELIKKSTEWVLKRAGSSFGLKGGAGQAVDVDKLRREYDEYFDRLRPSPPVDDDAISDEKVVTRGADDISLDALAQDIEDGLDNDPQFKDAFEQAYNATLPPNEVVTRGAGTRVRAEKVLLSEEAKREMFGADAGVMTRGFLSWFAIARFVAKIVLAVLKRYRGHRDHGAYCTIVEEVLRIAYADLIGSTIWNQMKQDTLDSFQTGADFCGTAVVEHLKRLESEGATFPQITLVGHSTGAIYICHFLEAARKVDLKTPIKVVFLAPALTHTLFAEAIRNHGQSSRMSAFRMFAMSDELECKDKLLGVVYTRSLLYFVSGLLEGEQQDGKWQALIDMPIGGMQRYLLEATFGSGEFEDVGEVSRYFKARDGRVVWSPSSAGAGFNSNADSHGGFDDDDATLESVSVFIGG
jgi:hypothetical protein